MDLPKERIVKTIIMLLYTDYLDIDEYTAACYRLKISKATVLSTKCSFTTAALGYLWNFTPHSSFEHPITFDPKYAYTVELLAAAANLGHVFTLLPHSGTWLLFDSYINKRELSCRQVNPDIITSLLTKLSESYTPAIWKELTEVVEEEKAETMAMTITAYKFDVLQSNTQYGQLVKRAQHRLHNEDIGQDDLYLSLLSPRLEVEEADSYLKIIV